MLIPIIIILAAALLVLAAIVIWRTAAFAGREDSPAPIEPQPADATAAAEHLAEAIHCKTISDVNPSKVDIGEFRSLHKLLERTYPLLHRRLERQVIGERSLLYKWQGSQPDLKPILFAGHLDVVPADANALEGWHYPPFDGTVADGIVWGRGSQDNKNQVVALLESAETLLGKGYQPRRTIYLAFGGDEEVGGLRGAKEIVRTLKEQGVELAAALDEGGSILGSALPGVEAQLALVGVAEKGALNLELTVQGAPGHSSQPPPHTAIGILAQALTALEDHPFPLHASAIRSQVQAAGHTVPFPLRMVFANLWLFGGLAARRMASSRRINATMRTTTAVTVISGGVKENVLPGLARAVVNFRILPGDNVAGVIEHARKVINNEDVTIKPREKGARDPSPVSETDAPAYAYLKRTIQQFFPGLPVVPTVTLGATDARHYLELSRRVYRFTPVHSEPADMQRVHGIDERIAVAELAGMVQFYQHLMQVWAEEMP